VRVGDEREPEKSARIHAERAGLDTERAQGRSKRAHGSRR
jgi:hypothetical protein